MPFKVDIVIPVYNEEECLKRNILQLLGYLKDNPDFIWNILIVDNCSTDKTPQIAGSISLKNDKIKYIFLPFKGVGYALKKAFSLSNADIICYMDADLSVNLKYLRPLIEGITTKGFDISVGSRLLRESIVKRKLSRKLISIIYNISIKILFANNFTDAGCGFKAIKADLAKKLMGLIKSNTWFFDTEFLLLADYNNFKILEIPVECEDYSESKVNIIKTIFEDICGLFRMRFANRKTFKIKIDKK